MKTFLKVIADAKDYFMLDSILVEDRLKIDFSYSIAGTDKSVTSFHFLIETRNSGDPPGASGFGHLTNFVEIS